MFCRQSPVHTQPKLPSWQHFLLQTLEPSQCGIIPTFNTTTQHIEDKIQKLFISISFHANKKFWDGAPKRLSLAQRSYNVDALILSTEGGNTQPYDGVIKGDGNCGVLGIAASEGQNQQVRSLPWIVSHSVIARCELNYWIRQSFRGFL